ncbi:Zinc finger protein 407 [Amphibalanus amphitrite]|uniref:Zinc finger protein 407 n=1 Tax=Amphibalanus amphitrite TaxID=1232801 RepID=A0A6A4W864_AMPAM|nr:Zinc finger protein 407 [Amphibalanus amphitrite]
MADANDIHHCLACSRTIIGLDAYVAHRQTGCSALTPTRTPTRTPNRTPVITPARTPTAARPRSSLPIIDVKKITLGDGVDALKGVLRGVMVSPGGPELATIQQPSMSPATVIRAGTLQSGGMMPLSKNLLSSTIPLTLRVVPPSPPEPDPEPELDPEPDWEQDPDSEQDPWPEQEMEQEQDPETEQEPVPPAVTTETVPFADSPDFADDSPAGSPAYSPPPSPPADEESSPPSSPVRTRSAAKRKARTRCKECGIQFKTRNALSEHIQLTHKSGLQPSMTTRAMRKLGKRKPGLREPAWVRSAQEAAAVAGLEPGMQSDDEFGAVEDILKCALKRQTPPPPQRKAKRKKRVTFKDFPSSDEDEAGGDYGNDGDGDARELDDDFGEWSGDEIDDSVGEESGKDANDSAGGGGDSEGRAGSHRPLGKIYVKSFVETLYTCPLCGPVHDSSLASHVFSEDHVAAYQVFKPALDETSSSGEGDSMAALLNLLTVEAMASAAPYAPYRCLPCQFSCNLLSDLKLHIKSLSHRLRRAEKRCSRCDEPVLTEDHLDTPEHQRGPITLSAGGNGFGCGLCQAQFELEFAARQHVVRRHSADPLRISMCKQCGLVMTPEMKKGHRHFHFVSRRCETCGKLLNSAQEVEKHLRKSLCQYDGNVRQGKHACRHCDFRNNLKVNVLFHESLTHHAPHTSRKKTTSRPTAQKGATGKRTPLRYLCPLCDLYFRKPSLKSHLMKHTGEAPFHCLYCSRYFFLEEERDHHELVSHQERQRQHKNKLPSEEGTIAGVQRAFQPEVGCPICEKKFPNGHAARMHLNREHRGEERRCPVEGCDFSSTHSSLLNRHLKVQHPDYRRFSCTQCSFSCSTAIALDTHMNLHTGLKPYKCKHCEFATRFPPHLKRHMRIHTGSRPFPCPYCEYKANNFENLRKHIITTRCHPGLSMYMCKFCTSDDPSRPQFGTNYAREFKKHLREEHSDQFDTNASMATYVAGLYNRDDDVIETNVPISHTYKERSKIPRPRRLPVAKSRGRQLIRQLNTDTPAAPSVVDTTADSVSNDLTITVLPGKQFFRLSRGRGQPPLLPRGKVAIVAAPLVPQDPLAIAGLTEAGQKEAETVPTIDYVSVGDSLSLQIAPPADTSLGTMPADESRTFAPPPVEALQSELVDDPGDSEPRPTRFSGSEALDEPVVPQVHIEDQSVHRTTLIQTDTDNPDNEVISLETNLPTEITVVHSEDTGECSSLLMTFFTDKGSRHVMVPRDVIIHKPDEPPFRRVKVVFTPDETEGADKVTIHKFY